MISEVERRRLCQDMIDQMRQNAAWAREHAGTQPIDSKGWMSAMSVAQSTDAHADQLQAELDA